MDLSILRDTPPWEWPGEADEIILGVLRDDRAEESERLLAAELAGDLTVMNEALAEALVSVASAGDQAEALRCRAVISLGPVLEYADTDGFDDPDEMPISEATFHRIQESLCKLYLDTGLAKKLRRRILEAAVRAPQDWHPEAVRAAYSLEDELWKLTAVFCMRFVRGFDRQIIEALESRNLDIHYQAVRAAGAWGLEDASSHVSRLIRSKDTDKPLLLAAIEAIASIQPREAAVVLYDLMDSRDEDISEAVHEALSMADFLEESEDWDPDEDDDFLR